MPAVEEFEDPNAFAQRALELMNEGLDPDAAEQLFVRAMEHNPDDLQNMLNFAWFLEHTRGDLLRAQEILLVANARFSENIEVLTPLAQVCDRCGNLTSAKQYYLQATQLAPDDVAALFNYGCFLEDRLLDLDGAQPFFERVLLTPNPQPIHYYRLGRILERHRNDLDRAQAQYEAAIHVAPESAFYLDLLADFFLTHNRSPERVEDLYLKAIEREPTNARIVGNLALHYDMAMDDLVRAERYYLQALALEPDNVHTIDNYAGFLEQRKKDFVGAEAYYTKAIELAPNDGRILGNFAWFVDGILKDLVRAEQLYQRAVEARPDDAFVHSSFGSFLAWERKDFARAEAMVQRAMALDPEDANVFANAAHAAFLRRDFAAAIERMRTAESLLAECDRRDTPIELAFYHAAHIPQERPSQLRELRKLIDDDFRSPNWRFAGHLEILAEKGDPDLALFTAIAAVIADGLVPATLETFSTWSALDG